MCVFAVALAFAVLFVTALDEPCLAFILTMCCFFMIAISVVDVATIALPLFRPLVDVDRGPAFGYPRNVSGVEKDVEAFAVSEVSIDPAGDDNARGWGTVGEMSTAWLSSPEIDNERDGPTVGAKSTAWLSSRELDNERGWATVGAMSTAWLSSPEVVKERDGPTVGAMSSAWLSSGAGLSVIYDGR